MQSPMFLSAGIHNCVFLSFVFLSFLDFRVFSWFWLTVFYSFPDVVNSRFSEQVGTFLKSLTPFLKRLSFSWKCWQPWKTLRWFAKRLEAQSLQRVSSDIPPAKLWINLQTLLILAINFVFPHLFLFTGLFMGIFRNLISNAHVRTMVVVEVDKALYLL